MPPEIPQLDPSPNTKQAYDTGDHTKDINRRRRNHTPRSGTVAEFGNCATGIAADTTPPDARQGDLFGAKPFDRRDGRQIYVSLLVLVVPFLPGKPASVAQPERRGAEFRPFAAPVAGLRHRRDALSGELQPAKHTGACHPAEYHSDGRHPQALLVAQPPRPVRPQGV